MSWSGVKKQTNIEDIEDIKAWCEEMGIKNYNINSLGEIDVDGIVSLRNQDFEELPYKFGRVKGSFDLSGNTNLKSLKNCPKYVGGYFGCDECPKINSLEGCPKEVGWDFYCRDCKKQFTKEYVNSLCKVKYNIYI